MWKILLALSVLYIFSGIISIRCLEKRDIPWFIHEEAVYYIETKPSYTSSEAQNICEKKNMTFTVAKSATSEILKYITSVYGHDDFSFWIYDNEYYGNQSAKPKKSHHDSCYKLSTRDSDFHEENCTNKMSFLCKRLYVSASLYFVNGTHQEIGFDDVETYCNPHSQEYDEVLKVCLIRYFKKSEM